MEKEVVANTSSLIFIAKLDIFNLAKNLFSRILAPKQVINEILEKDNPETLIIKRELKKFLKESGVKKIRDFSLGEGEKAAISLCLERKIKTFLSDDKKARNFARSLNLGTVGTIGILLWNLEHEKITKGELLKILNKLIDNGYYISPRLYAEIMKIVDSK